ncbi:hypothetical protein SUGI_0319140 [Cryptomeria japonica]|nr:hypothetical protein SUGI_0319140 [Cryptomeria japonica]
MRRDNNKDWRCRNPRAPGKIYCLHHIELQKDKYERLKLKKKNPNLELGGPSHSCQKKLKSEENDIIQTAQEIGLTQRCLSNNSSRIGEPQICQRFAVPSEIFDLADLSEILTTDSWNDCLSPADRCYLHSFLPQQDKSDCLVESLLRGKLVRFGKNCVGEWGEKVCMGQQSPDFLVHRENKIRHYRSKYLKGLTNYHETMIVKLERMGEH